MPLFRRRARHPDADRIRAGFDAVAEHVVAAQRSLLAAIPTARDDGVPLAQALAAFGEHLEAVRAAMEAWRDTAARSDSALHEWTTCWAALVDARGEAERLRLEPAGMSFERLNARVGDVLHPLETFSDAERALRRL